jgi:Nucleoside-diphosphate-sugar pyrophosphorylase involved in lipopolysaccharide biosynthesis/translation initiation factor 2B, gamma/epsilon subunits (eIF-2Bgamma/eIF-2Bepsilon)
MKVVLFCGGLGTRLRDYDESIPKPMVPIGYRPIMWNLMKYYAHFGHKDFILCLGHKADVIKQYFVNYNECLSNDFVMREGGRQVELLNSDIHDWTITFADTGLMTPIGERLRLVRRHLQDEEIFLANYSDCLTDLDLAAFMDTFRRSGRLAGFVTVAPSTSYHYVEVSGGVVKRLIDARTSPLRVNGGFFAFRREIFDYIQPGEELVDAPFRRLIEKGELMTYDYNGFWKAMDTFKDKQQLDEMLRQGNPPWEIWRTVARAK